jgi:hypothetical protein
MSFNDVLAVLIPGILILSALFLVLKLFVALTHKSQRPTKQDLEVLADIKGNAGADAEEEKVKAIFREFRERENLP